MIPLILLLFLMYIAISGSLTLSNVLLGLALAAVSSALIRPQSRRPAWRRLPGALLALARYILLLAWELAVSGLQVARLAFSRTPALEPGIVAIPSDCRSELAQALNMHAISLTPGELVVEVGEDGTLYTHVLDVSRASEQVAAAQRLRQALLRQIFV
jgi:multicomponent Na+:H+ antiporter subunit E